MKTEDFETRMEWRGKIEKEKILELRGYLGRQRWCTMRNQGLFGKSSFLLNKIGANYKTIANSISFPLPMIQK